jgi:hypothetical protein
MLRAVNKCDVFFLLSQYACQIPLAFLSLMLFSKGHLSLDYPEVNQRQLLLLFITESICADESVYFFEPTGFVV